MSELGRGRGKYLLGLSPWEGRLGEAINQAAGRQPPPPSLSQGEGRGQALGSPLSAGRGQARCGHSVGPDLQGKRPARPAGP